MHQEEIQLERVHKIPIHPISEKEHQKESTTKAHNSESILLQEVGIY